MKVIIEGAVEKATQEVATAKAALTASGSNTAKRTRAQEMLAAAQEMLEAVNKAINIPNNAINANKKKSSAIQAAQETFKLVKEKQIEVAAPPAVNATTVKVTPPESVTSAKKEAAIAESAAATETAKVTAAEAAAEAAADSPNKATMTDAAANMVKQALIMTQQATMMQATNSANAKTSAAAYDAAKTAYDAAKTAYDAAKSSTSAAAGTTPKESLSQAYKTAMRGPVNNVINVAIEVQNTIEYLYQLIKTRDNDKDMMQLIRTFDNLAGKVLKAAEAVKKVTDKKMANNTTASSSSSSSSLDPLASVGLHVDNMIVHAGKMVTTATGIRSLTDPNALRAALNTFNAPFILFNEDMTQLNTLISKSGGRRTRSLRKNRRSKRTKRNKRSKRTQRNKRSKRTKRKHTK